jgi:hypothetical protein
MIETYNIFLITEILFIQTQIKWKTIDRVVLCFHFIMSSKFIRTETTSFHNQNRFTR